MIKSREARRLIDNLNTAVLMFDADLKLCTINASGESLLSSSSRMVCGQPAEFLFPGTALKRGMRGALETGQPFTERDLRVKVSGCVLKVDCTVTPIADAQKNACLLVEITVVDRHSRIVREEHILSQHHATNALIQGLAHEIKNPLGGIRGAAQLLQKRLVDDKYQEYLRVIIEEADRLRKLVDRMWGPINTPQKIKVNVHEVIEHVRRLVQAEVPETVQIVRDYDPSLPETVADRDQLIQAQLNIVRNAVQAVGNHGRITLRTRSERQFTLGPRRYRLVLRLDVIDDGPGIPSDLQEHVFYPLVTGRSTGTGLGLSIAQSLVHLHGGLIEFSSKPGETIFTTWLPLMRDLN
ncbi:MAG: nitrogen regulation protein NR(II) [Gammaproteobacteria bacterium]